MELSLRKSSRSAEVRLNVAPARRPQQETRRKLLCAARQSSVRKPDRPLGSLELTRSPMPHLELRLADLRGGSEISRHQTLLEKTIEDDKKITRPHFFDLELGC